MRGGLGIGLALLLLAPIARAQDGNVRFGGDLRLRGEGFDNVLDLSDEASDNFTFYRMRPRLWVDARPRDGLRVYFRLADEYRWGRGEKLSGSRDPETKIGIDNAWAGVRIAGGMSVRFGRQDLMYGEGFLVFDGTPADGSSTAYFDAAVASWTDGSAGTNVDLLMAKIAETGFAPGSGDEDFYALYLRKDPAEVYLLHRNQRSGIGLGPGGGYPDILHPAHKTTALGARYARIPELGPHLAAEGAYEMLDDFRGSGHAFGGYARGGFTGGARKLGVEAGGLYLSGDDPKTGKIEGWDGFYSEWPKYSEGVIYTVYDGLTRIRPDDAGSWTNAGALWLEIRAVPVARARVSLRATKLLAVENSGPGTGTDRGILFAAQANLDLGPGLAGQAVAEYFDPGDFYARAADAAWYARWQITAKF
jgi:hypothetical protein